MPIFSENYINLRDRASLVAQWYRTHLPMQETWVQSLGQEDPLEKEMITRSCLETPMDWGATEESDTA